MSNFKTGDEIVFIGVPEEYSTTEYDYYLLCPEAHMTNFTIGKVYTVIDNVSDGPRCVSLITDDGFGPILANSEFFILKSEHDMQNRRNNTESKRIPFDLERAKKGDKVINQDGQSVRIICFDRNENGYPILALHNELNREHCQSHRIDGSYTNNSFGRNLFMAPVDKTGWIGLFRLDGDTQTLYRTTNVYDTEELVLGIIRDSYRGYEIICIKQISWEE